MSVSELFDCIVAGRSVWEQVKLVLMHGAMRGQVRRCPIRRLVRFARVWSVASEVVGMRTKKATVQKVAHGGAVLRVGPRVVSSSGHELSLRAAPILWRRFRTARTGRACEAPL